MQFDLKCAFILSGKADGMENDVEKFIEDANKRILKKRGEGAEIVSWNIKGNVLEMRIVSGRKGRSHEGALRIKKSLGSILGKKYKIGVREVAIKEYTITFEADEKPLKELTIPFADVYINEKKVTIKINEQGEEFLRENYVDRMIKVLQEKIHAQHYEGKKEYWKLLWQSEEKKPLWNKDPSEEMQKKGWVVAGPTKGKWFYRPPAAAILRAMERIAVEEVLAPLGFQEVVEPMHVPLETWIKTGHLEGMPGEFYYICEPVTRDAEQWEHFIDLVKITKEVPMEELRKNVKVPKAGVCYAQCPNIYWSLSGKTIAEKSLPLLLFDRSVPSDRYESGGRHGIERVDEFHRVEAVYIGTKEQLLEIKEKLIEKYRHVFDDILELEWRMAQVTPFYLQQAGIVGGEEEKEKGTIDFEAWLPYRGGRDKEWLEIQNISIVGEKYTKAFTIKSQKKEVWSGCSGIGLERWMVAFLAQKGIEPEKWPSGFKKYLSKLPEMPEFL